MKSAYAGAAILVLLPLLGSAALSADGTRGPQDLTFFGWSDQHLQTNGDADHLLPAIDAMNNLPDTQYPDRIGGAVETPAFVFGCGDITEWPTTAAKNRYAALIEKRLKFPAYDIAGNHDGGGKAPSETPHRWIIARHGASSYSFDRGGVHFTAVFSKYDESLNSPAQPVSQEALDFIRSDLNKEPQATPVVVALHVCFDAITNRDELVDAFGEANVIAVLGGHYHKAKADRFRNVNFLQLPSPAPNSQPEIMVIRIARDRLLAIPYATVGFYWRWYERERGKPQYEYTDKVVAWCRERGIRLKGHPLLRGNESGIPVWSRVQPSPGIQRQRVTEIMQRYQGKIEFWEVVNEPSHLPRLKIDDPYRWAREAERNPAIPSGRLQLPMARGPDSGEKAEPFVKTMQEWFAQHPGGRHAVCEQVKIMRGKTRAGGVALDDPPTGSLESRHATAVADGGCLLREGNGGKP